MAHKKGQGSSRNGRDSNAQRLGVKRFGGENVVAGKADIVEWLRQRGRPFVFSSAVTPADVGACIAAIDVLEESTELVDHLWSNTSYFKGEMKILVTRNMRSLRFPLTIYLVL